jgi:ABC-type branched-subunit amino acid transport system ATPase component
MTESVRFEIPITSADALNITLAEGEIVFILGANGTGKSSLVTRLFNQHWGRSKRISAHRQTWFTSNSLEMTASSRSSIESSIRGQDVQEQSRHIMHYGAERTMIAIFDLIDAETMLNRKIADHVRRREHKAAEDAAEEPSPLHVINQLMRYSNLPIKIEVEAGQKIFARRNGGAQYSVAELSDGERNAFLVAADVLTAQPGSIILIDEPERHLHRSIISPLLTQLFKLRSDCSFFVSTHELMLPLDNPEARTLLVRSCAYSGSSPSSWAIDVLEPNTPIDEQVKLDILGGRQRILFIEGTAQSLDAPLYALLFPEVSVVPRSTCRDVELAVRGLRGASGMHWLEAWGIVDHDRRPPTEIERLRAGGIHALPYYSIEALYYHPEVLAFVGNRMATMRGIDPSQLVDGAKSAAISEAEKRRDHFVLGAVERFARRKVMAAFPDKADIKAGGKFDIQVDLSEMQASEEGEFDRAIGTSNLHLILERYPLRESGALNGMATALGFRCRIDYEEAVRAAVVEDPSMRALLRGFFGRLASEISPIVSGTDDHLARLSSQP